jgi:hypothetical protein
MHMLKLSLLLTTGLAAVAALSKVAAMLSVFLIPMTVLHSAELK